jgi:sugar phosphate isomerase/epimerase
LEQLGIKGIELETALSGLIQEKKESVGEALSNSTVKLSTVLLGYQGDLVSKHREIRERALERIKQYLKACAELGGIGVVTVPSRRKGRSPLDLFLPRKKENKKALAIEQYRTLGKYATELGVYIIIEPLDHFRTNFVNTCDEAVEICRMTGSGMVKICPDLFHMSIEEPSINERIKEFSDYVVHLHVGDNDLKSRFAILPGKGTLDFMNILRTLKETRYSNYLSLDCRIPSEEELLSSVGFLKKMIQ